MSTILQQACRRALAITPSDSADLPGGTPSRGIYVGGAGNIVCDINGQTVTFTGVPVGSILPIAPSRVRATSTTATGLIALYLQ